MRTQMVFFQLTEKILFISGGRNMSPKFTNDWGLQQINSVLSSLMVYSLHPRLQKATEPHLQRVFMADACHLNFGKYTLFSCYGVTANTNAPPVAFAIICGNESTSTKRQFWKYALELHPSLDAGDITIITDRDKGQKNAIDHYLKSVRHFHFSYHRRQNITKMCGGGGGKLPNSALWMYNKLMKCRNVQQLKYNKEIHFVNMTNKDIKYLNGLDDHAQYLAARCAMRNNVYMYNHSASGVVE